LAADLHIHVVRNEEIEKHVRQYLRKDMWSSEKGPVYLRFKGSDGKWYRWDEVPENLDVVKRREIRLKFDENVVYKTPNVWIGEVSWLKADLLGSDEFLPGPVVAVQDIFYEKGRKGIIVLDEKTIGRILAALETENKTKYETTKAAGVRKFLRRHQGKKAFTISW